MALRSDCGSASSAACSAASAAEAPPAIASTTAWAKTGVEPMFTSADARRAVVAHGGHADDRPVLGPPVELLERPPGAGHLRHPDLGEQLVGRERGLEEALKKSRDGDLALAVRARAPRIVPPSASTTAGQVRRRDRRGRASRRSCRGGAPADRRPDRRRGARSGTSVGQQVATSRGRGGGCSAPMAM